MADQTQEYTLSHTGGLLGSSKVTTASNQTAPQRETAIISFEVPRKFSEIEYVGQRDATRFVPRTTEEITGTANDDTVVQLQANIQPIAGEEDMADQDYPVVVAYNVTQGAQVEIADVNYATDEVTLATDPADGDTVKLWPIMGDGEVQFRLVNQFGQEEGRVYPWATPLYRWHDFPQLKRGREINLHGSVTWQENETVEVLLDAPQAITWEDADYPEGQYVSTFEQDVEITL
ncbi:head protein [Haloarcula californiae icosahedral virus 1]|uniref:VP4 n=1 Tax=Haloarcula californiae icosahedral virus 1 TaxID=1735722 RepID=A0A1C7A3R2_9VIRU|nr:head protein [Haloarcula californiae icosahedral virus 1]6H9C_A Chain A, VP4 [Haloarcula californiae ATCC 33799]6H9C_B Chain B, VP4 [Haloarcula californiae ATCC 33799]6H9C_C Chain C, VP4 [Haloarcula californiae ATCC 33799]6H9C_G Chain G, VP4 [Haloarcula californiae ATCC 33799]6H9C_H Chain H, VP4 [Haloarcula californiae ATCC 33799]6H9C_O Chain O, VP4 [Haloarcula californiae ATCC 33799]6H9C_P Chain P, VP4 [Haloarcula californiae ATCC 33799]6H9C_Q Chain Q, VP4 [Haloarcula californiae ATCC 3